MNLIDQFLNRITMYRLVLYYLIVLVALAAVFGALGLVPYSPIAILFSTLIFLISCGIGNLVFARATGAKTNVESFYITALILALLVSPVSYTNPLGIALLALIGVWAMASKYLIAIGKKHIFNPVAFALALSALVFNQPATWWVAGNLYLLPFVVIGGLLITRKIRRFDVVFSFAAVALLTIAFTSFNPLSSLTSTLTGSSFFFLGLVMLTEPVTLPPSRTLRLIYGAIVGFLFAPAIHLGSFYFTPEIALLVGNAFSYLVSPKRRYLLTLTAREKLARGIYEFIFTPDRPLAFVAGQYVEWTLPHTKTDSRGNRRYFTLASSPQEGVVRLGVKFSDPSSSFKRGLTEMRRGDTLSIASLAGDFVLPKDRARKLAFIAGGIGITPFRSMIGELLATGEKRDVVLLYSTKNTDEIAYRPMFDEAVKLGIRTEYVRLIDEHAIMELIPDYRERAFYISGPDSMVKSFKKSLRHMGVRHIKTDYFPGF